MNEKYTIVREIIKTDLILKNHISEKQVQDIKIIFDTGSKNKFDLITNYCVENNIEIFEKRNNVTNEIFATLTVREVLEEAFRRLDEKLSHKDFNSENYK